MSASSFTFIFFLAFYFVYYELCRNYHLAKIICIGMIPGMIACSPAHAFSGLENRLRYDYCCGK